MRNCIIFTLHQKLLGDHVKEVGLGWLYSTHGEVKNSYRIFIGKPTKARDHSKDLGVDGMIILTFLLENMVGGCGLDSSGSG